MDSDSSDDELMMALANRVDAQAFYEDCAYCATGGAMNPCTACHAAFYCSETCKRRHFKSHRAFCIRARQEQEQQQQSEEEEFESESEEDEDEEDEMESSDGFDDSYRFSSRVTTSGVPSFRHSVSYGGPASSNSTLSRRASYSVKRSSSAYSSRSNRSRPPRSRSGKDRDEDKENDDDMRQTISKLTSKQLKRLVELSNKAEQIPDTSKLDKIQKQVAELWTSRDSFMARPGASFHAATSTCSSCETPQSLVTGEKEATAVEYNNENCQHNQNGRNTTNGAASSPSQPVPKAKKLPSEKLNEIKELRAKLAELEKKTLAISASSPSLRNLRGLGVVGMSPTFGSVSSSHHFAMLQRCQNAGIRVYLPKLVKDDDAFRKYFKLKDLNMPIDIIKRRMASDGVDPELLDTPNAKSPNDEGPPEGAYIPMTVGDDPKFQRYFKLKLMNMPFDQIKMKMEVDGIDPELLDHPERISPNDLGPQFTTLSLSSQKSPHPLSPDASSFSSTSTKDSSPASSLSLSRTTSQSFAGQDSLDAVPITPLVDPSQNDHRLASTDTPANSAPVNESIDPNAAACIPVAPVERKPLLVKDDPKFRKYFKLVQMGMPKEQVQLKMTSEGVDASLLDGPDDVSPNDVAPAPPSQLVSSNGSAVASAVAAAAAAAISSNGSDQLASAPEMTLPPGSGNPVSLEHLYSLIMQHHQIIQQGSFSSASAPTSRNGSVDSSQPRSSRSSVDHMANELAAAESAVEDLFGDDQAPRSSSGMSMIQQLERKARRDTNKKIVEKRMLINQLVAETISKQFTSDQDAIGFYGKVMPQFEDCGLVLGTEATGSLWSTRLLIKNKDTRDWYFSEQERVQAGRAYDRLWALSFLERDTMQLISKRDQLLQAPANLLSTGMNKNDMISRFTLLLKEAVRLKHKIFKNQFFRQEVARLHGQNVPERLVQRGDEMMQAARALADACMALVEDEFRAVERTTRCQRLRAQSAVSIAERAMQFVGIVIKLQVQGVDGVRLGAIESTVASYRDRFRLDEQQEEEEEEDVL